MLRNITSWVWYDAKKAFGPLAPFGILMDGFLLIIIFIVLGFLLSI